MRPVVNGLLHQCILLGKYVQRPNAGVGPYRQLLVPLAPSWCGDVSNLAPVDYWYRCTHSTCMDSRSFEHHDLSTKIEIALGAERVDGVF